jgi:hypothetical protein
MAIRLKPFIPALLLGFIACATLSADLIPGDLLSITLDPVNGVVSGATGSTVGWGFTATWTSTHGDWISFTGSSLGSVAAGESNPGVLTAYTDFIGAQGGPNDFAIGPGDSPWTQIFDGASLGIGAYQITSDPSFAGADDHGQITINYDVTDRDPLAVGAVDLGTGSYFGSSTQFDVTVDTGSETPEPATFGLFLSGFAALFAIAWRRRRSARA